MAVAVANRYATALADAVSRNDYRKVLGELHGFLGLWRESLELRQALDSPALNLPQKLRILNVVAARLELSLPAANFLRVLTVNYRMNLLPQACLAFRRVLNQRMGVVEVRVLSAGALSEAEKETLRGRFVQFTGHEVELDWEARPELVGGVVAKIGSTVYDGSVRGQLDRMRQKLTAQ